MHTLLEALQTRADVHSVTAARQATEQLTAVVGSMQKVIATLQAEHGAALGALKSELLQQQHAIAEDVSSGWECWEGCASGCGCEHHHHVVDAVFRLRRSPRKQTRSRFLRSWTSTKSSCEQR